MTKLQAIREFCSFVCGQPIIIARDRFHENNWAMDIDDKVPRLKMPMQIPPSLDDTDKIFRKDFTERCPLAKGFSHITLTLLHECGHWATRSVMDVVEYDKWEKKSPTQIEYMMIPWEHLATDWAICWLNCPANRQIAKRFERDYFGY
jgi:hypothetical protein